MIQLDKVLVDKVRNLNLKLTEEPQPELLICMPNQHQDTTYEVEIVTREFTSLCPLNLAQPDYATIVIRYTPKNWCVELKSLKFYLVSYRQVAIFHESIPALILDDLASLLEPLRMEVVGQFSTRGGLDTTVKAVYNA